MTVLESAGLKQTAFDELHARPENQDRHLELWQGELVETMPSRLHAWLQAIFIARFMQYFAQNPIGMAYAELHIRPQPEGYALVPDVCIVLNERGETDWNRPLPFMPDLVVEIQSPDQSDGFMLDKARYYLTQGVRLVIVVYHKRIVEVWSAESRQLLLGDDVITAEAVLPGFSLPLGELFPAGSQSANDR